jgi:hypothetical protein
VRSFGGIVRWMDPVLALLSLGGAARWKSLIEAGVTDGHLRAAVRRGHVVRRGVAYALPEAADDVVVAARLDGRLTCTSAAPHLGLDRLFSPARPHVAVPRSTPRRESPAVVHRTGAGPGRVVPRLDALEDAVRCRCLPPVETLVMVDSALRARRIDVLDLRCRFVGPGSARHRGLLDLADPRSGSPIETVARLALRAAGLPVVSQVWFPEIGRVDFVIGGWLVVEVDGYGFHSTREQFRNDRRRANLIAARGMVLLRFSFDDVMHRSDHVVAQVTQVLVAGRPR